MKQDRAGVRTAQDLERKYDLSSLVGLKKAVELQAEGINKTNAELEQFSNTIIEMSTKVETAIHSVDVMYALGDSETTAPTSGWNTEAPTWQKDKYMWQKTVTTFVDGRIDESSPTCISGAKGSDGESGTDGKGIKQIINYYLANNLESGVTTTTSGWTEAIQSVSTTKKYLWNYEKIIYTDNSVITTEPCIIGAYGDTGPQGPKGEQGEDGTGVTILGSYDTEAALRTAHPTGNTGDAYLVEGNLFVWCIEDNDWRNVGNIKGPKGEQGPEGSQGPEGPQGDTGVGIESITEHYAVSNSNTAEPSNWNPTPPNMTPDNKYLWNYETIFYTNGTSVNTVKRVIGVYGDTGENGPQGETGPQGDTGIGVDDVLEQYYLSSSNTTQTGGTWSEQQVTWQEGKYIWTRSKITWTDNTTSYTTPVLASAINGVNENLSEVSKKVDTKISTWYYSGEPTLSNVPASDWTTNELKAEHIGDLYYDKETGYAYIFSFEGGAYGWKGVKDKDTIEALAKANAASDTADSKRRVFLAPPQPPYDNGDLWLNDGEIYVCQISKVAEEVYAEEDFIIAVKYTDDTLATQVGNELTVVRGTVTTIKENQDEFRINLETTTKLVDQYKNEVDSVVENMTYSFGTKDLQIASSTDPVNLRINNQGMKVYTYKELSAVFNHNGSGIQKLIVVGDSQIANLKVVKAVDEDGNACTDFHHLISNIQSLSDLE